MTLARLPRLGRLAVAGVVGVVAAVVLARVAGLGARAVAAGWVVGALTFLAWTWLVIGRMSAEQTRDHATVEDPTRGTSDVVLLSAGVASILGVGLLLLGSSDPGSGKVIDAAAGVAVVTASWLLVHTMFTLRYADLYYRETPGGVDFNQDEPPTYRDFAYLAFTIGMTYQVSDTNLETPAIRGTALRQGLLAYLFGTVIVATAINLAVQLATSGGGG